MIDHAESVEEGGISDGFGFSLLFEVFLCTAVVGEPKVFDSHCADGGGETVDFCFGPEFERVC